MIGDFLNSVPRRGPGNQNMATPPGVRDVDAPTRQILAVIDRLYEARLDPSQWRVALTRIIELFDGFAGNLNYYENAALHSVDLSFSVLEGLGPAGLADYKRYVLRDVRFPALVRQPWHPGPRPGISDAELASFMHGTPFTERMVITEGSLRDSEIYQHLLRPHGIEYALMCADFEFDDTAFALGNRGHSIGVFRGPASPAFQQADCDRMHLLGPHVKRAVDIHTAVGRLRGERDIAFTWLNQLALGSVILDHHDKVIFANAIAKQFAAAADGFELSDNRLHIQDQTARSQFEQLLIGKGPADTSTVNLQRAGGRLNLQLRVVALANPLAGQARPGLRAVFIFNPDRPGQFRIGALRAVYGLTDTEAQVADALAHGTSVHQIARERQVSPDAVRFHLKNLYQKTGTHRQAELVQLILNNPFWQHDRESESIPRPTL